MTTFIKSLATLICLTAAFRLLPEVTAASATNDENDNPLFLLHVGPPKTGTTTLQYFLSEYRESFAKDNWLYVGRWYDEEGDWLGYQDPPFAQMTEFECQVHTYADDPDDEEWGLVAIYNDYLESLDGDYNSTQEVPPELQVDWTHNIHAPECWKRFLLEMHRIRRLGMNVLVSDEMICIRGHNQEEFHFDMLKDTLSPDWNVQILATYRRFHAWLPSEKNQYDQYKLSDWGEMYQFLEWDGEDIPHMYDYIKRATDDHKKIKYPYLDDIVRDYGAYFGDIKIMNMHDLSKYNTLVSQMVCEFIPNATETCALSLDDPKATASKVLNAAKSAYYDNLAMAAYANGMLPQLEEDDRLTRVYVRDEVEHYHETILGKKPTDFPLSCPPLEEMEPLLVKSFEYEERFFPEFHKDQQEKHREEFLKSFNKKRFCSIDTDAALEQEEWITFFKDLEYVEEDEKEPENAEASEAVEMHPLKVPESGASLHGTASDEL